MNKKGFTLVEIIVSISLVSVVMIFLFQVLITVINGNKRNNTKSKTLISKAIVMKAVEQDLDTFGLSNDNGVLDCSGRINQVIDIKENSINQIIPATADLDYYCIKFTYNANNVKYNEGFLLFYKNNNKGFLAYKRGKGNVLETQIVREIDAVPIVPLDDDLIKKVVNNDIYSLKIDIPIIANDGNNYDLILNYIDSKPVSFAKDSWETIAKAVRDGNTSMYNVGDTKEIAIKGFTNTEAGSNGLYTVRIANKSTPRECNTNSFSQSACGFVVEFVDIITTYNINPAGTYNGIEYPYGTNVGGWPASAMYKYLNGDTSNRLTYGGTNATIYSKLPSDLQSVIKDTKVVSGHGSVDSGTRADGNWESTDKLYLLTTGEIYSNCLTENCYDTASYSYNESGSITTRQLDYYNGVSTGINKARAIKQKNGTNTRWWLRGASAGGNRYFRTVTTAGDNYRYDAYSDGGLAPAFRIGK